MGRAYHTLIPETSKLTILGMTTRRSTQQNSIIERGGEVDVIDAVDRTLAILECFCTERPELGISEISRELGIHKSTAFRSLASLEARGLVRKDPLTRRYSVGPGILGPAGAYLSTVELHEKARPVMESLRSSTKETVSLYVPAGDRCVCIDRVESPLEVRRVIRIGDQVPLVAGSSGKVLLAYASDLVRRELLASVGGDGASPPDSDSGSLEVQLAEIRERGVAVSHAERVPQVSSASAPIFDATGEVVAAITVSGPSSRFTGERVEAHAVLVKQAAMEISASMGYGLYPKPQPASR